MAPTRGGPPTDSARRARLEWERAHYHQAVARAYGVDVDEEPGRVTVSADVGLVAPSVQPALRGRLVRPPPALTPKAPTPPTWPLPVALYSIFPEQKGQKSMTATD